MDKGCIISAERRFFHSTQDLICRSSKCNAPRCLFNEGGKPIVSIPYDNNAKSADLAVGTPTISIDGDNSVAIKGSTFAKSTDDAGGDKKTLDPAP